MSDFTQPRDADTEGGSACSVVDRLGKLARMTAPLRSALTCMITMLLLAILSSGPSALAQAVAQSPSDATASIRPDHQAEDLERLLDIARDRGQTIVVRLEPASAATATAGTGQLEASVFAWWRAASGSFLGGLDRGIQGVFALPQLPDKLVQAWRHNAVPTPEALARIAAVIGGALLLGLLVRRLAGAVLLRRAPQQLIRYMSIV